MTARRPIRVAFVVAGLESGGSERQMLEIAKRMPRDRFEVEFILFADRGPYADEAEAAGLHLTELRMGRRRDGNVVAFWARIVRMVLHYIITVRRRRYDIVDAWLWHDYVLAAVCRLVAGPRVLIMGRRSLSDYKERFGRIERFLDALARRSADLIVANADAVRGDVIVREGVDPARIRVIRNGVAIPPPMAPEDRAAIRERWGIGNEAIVLGSVANLKLRKGLEAVIRAAAELHGRHPELHVVMIGEGYLRAALEAQITAAGMADRIHLLGWQRDARDLYGAMDIVVHASESEGLPNVLLEAAAAGRPMVATAAGGAPEIVLDGQTGLLVPIGDEPALTGAIERLVTDPALRDRLAAAAREDAARRFGMDRLIAETGALYASMVPDRGTTEVASSGR
jgi:glycosyltransferase involved in cell wall biosynthesis